MSSATQKTQEMQEHATLPHEEAQLSALQKELLALAQSSFPLERDPYALLGEQMGVSGNEAYKVMQSLRTGGYVRRLGPVFDSSRLGYVSTLCVVASKDSKVGELAEYLNSFYQVTHNYLRESAYNLWFTVTAHESGELEHLVACIERVAASPVLQLQAKRLFKIKVDFNITGKQRATHWQEATVPSEVRALSFTEEDKVLIRLAQDDAFASRYPYQDLAQKLSEALDKTVCEQQVMQTFNQWKEAGALRRFGLTLRHRAVGFTHNVMVVWDVPDQRAVEAGTLMAQQDAVSHCYERSRNKAWPYNLYTMLHAKSREACEESIAAIESVLAAAGIDVLPPQRLVTLRELKKKSMKYFLDDEKPGSI